LRDARLKRSDQIQTRAAKNSNTLDVLQMFLVVPWAAATTAATQPVVPSMSPTNVFAPVSTPAKSIFGLSVFVLAVTAAIFVVVFTLLTYSVVRFRERSNDDRREPPQVYGSNQIVAVTLGLQYGWTDSFRQLVGVPWAK
jgi:hypothetical protein